MKENKYTPETKSFTKELEFQGINGKSLGIIFDEPELTSDAGLLPLAEHEKGLHLFSRIATCIEDTRLFPTHSLRDLIAQRAYQIASGNPDANDCDRMRMDVALQVAVGREEELASQPTMSRLENRITTKELIRIAYALVEVFFDSYSKPPDALVIDMDPTAHLLYGQQQLGLFNTHVGDTCMMPFHVYEGISGKLITTILRAGKTPTANEILAIMKRIVKQIRKRFPKTQIIFRADSHHTKPEVMAWFEKQNIDFITGLSPNARLNKQFAITIEQAIKRYELNVADKMHSAEVRCFASGTYQAGSWAEPQRVICRVIAGPNGVDTRYVVTSFRQVSAKYLYETVYCGRGQAELYIKEHKCGLESDRSPCQSANANQFRLFICSAVYMLMHSFREHVLQQTPLARATFSQIRLKLFKVAARIKRMKTRIRFHLPVAFQFKEVFLRLAVNLELAPSG
jgi:hypothetical protein